MKEQSDTPYYLLACSPYSETAAANPMRAYSKEDCAEIIAHEGGTAYVLAEDYERELATATRERDEARAEVERLRSALVDLVNQIRKCGPVDELGHRMTMNRAYLEAETLLDSAATEAKP